MTLLPGCIKTDNATVKDAQLASGRKPSPSLPVYFYFTNCPQPSVTGNFVAGKPAAATIRLDYINSPGGSYPAFTSSTVNGIKLTTPAGTLASGSGSIVFSSSGTPLSSGSISIPVSISGSLNCDVLLDVLNAPVSGPCSVPGAAPGSMGCVTFTYRGGQVTYATVRARDGKVWLQQNLGSPQVAFKSKDSASFGHYFQWGRWDDGHQVPTSPSVTGGPSLQNPSHIAGGNPNFIKGTTVATAWWATGGSVTNTWSGTNPTATNGKDPCVAIGAGWHLPSATEWTNVMNAEAINDEPSAFESTLRLPLTGYRASANAVVTIALTTNFGYYWSNTAASNTTAKVFSLDTYRAKISGAERGYGFSCRCVKD
jgi:uncharacterized protein (TIGR02145 family)